MTDCHREETEGQNKSLRVVATVDAPSSFTIGGETCGYGYEIMSEYALSTGKELYLSDNYSLSAAMTALDTHHADAVVTLQKSVNDDRYELIPLFTTDYVVLTAKKSLHKYKKAKNGLTDEVVGDAAIMLAAGFNKTSSYGLLLDSLRSAHIYSSSIDIHTLATETMNGKYDLLVCERSQAELMLYMTRGALEKVYEFDEPIAVNVMLRRTESNMTTFTEWFNEFSLSTEYRSLEKAYLRNGIGQRLRSLNRYNRILGGISVWDDLFRKVGNSEGVDWRLLSAIAYEESRFTEYVVSSQGAVGVMQIMPIVARHFGFAVEQLSNTETNIRIATKLINTIEKELRLPPDTPERDCLAIMLAAYNSGIGTIQRIRQQAERDGVDTDSWDTIEKYVVQKGIRQTPAYVRNVIERYEKYKMVINS